MWALPCLITVAQFASYPIAFAHKVVIIDM